MSMVMLMIMHLCVCMGENKHIKVTQGNLDDTTNLAWSDDVEKHIWERQTDSPLGHFLSDAQIASQYNIKKQKTKMLVKMLTHLWK